MSSPIFRHTMRTGRAWGKEWVTTDESSWEPKPTSPPSMQRPFKVSESIITHTHTKKDIRNSQTAWVTSFVSKTQADILTKLADMSSFLQEDCPRPAITEHAVCLHSFFLPLAMWVTQTQSIMSDKISKSQHCKWNNEQYTITEACIL